MNNKVKALRVGYAYTANDRDAMQSHVENLLRAGCEKIYQDELPMDPFPPPGLKDCLAFMRKGDTLVFDRVPRGGFLASGKIAGMIDDFEEMGIGIEVLHPHMVMDSPCAKFCFMVQVAILQYEYETTYGSPLDKKELQHPSTRPRADRRRP